MIFIESRCNLFGISDWDNKLENEVKRLSHASLYTNYKRGDDVKSCEDDDRNIYFQISIFNFALSLDRLV
jgi:hypothetical protein